VNDRVDYLCTRPEHQGAEPNDALTMHDERWAYCPTARTGPHEWRPTGGIPVEQAKALVRESSGRAISAVDQRSD
jgi:hypothetical protein